MRDWAQNLSRQLERAGRPCERRLLDEAVLSPRETCACGGRLRVLGEDVTEELEYIPGRFVVKRIGRPRLACGSCERIVQAPLPSRLIERGRPGPGLLAHVLVSKYADHCPLYRQSGIYAREGIDLDRSTLSDWVGRSTRLLEPLAEAVGRHVRAGPAIFTALYAVEKAARGLAPEDRTELRQDRAKPIRYALTRIKRLRPYLDHGGLEIDNNRGRIRLSAE